MEKKTGRKVLKIVGDVVFVIVMLFALFIAVTNLRARANNGIPNLFGKGFLTVNSDSMAGNEKDSFTTKDLVVVDIVNTKNYEERVLDLEIGDIITYYDFAEGKVISHRIIAITETGDATNPTFTVKGDNWAVTTAVSGRSVLAVYNHKVAGIGSIMAWFASGFGFFVIVVLPCVLFLVYEIYRFIKTLNEYNREKNANSKKDDTERLIALRKEALDDLVKSGVLSQEEADKKLQEYANSLKPVEVEAVETAEPSKEEVEKADEEVKD